MKQQKRKLPRADYGKKYVKKPSGPSDDFTFAFKSVTRGVTDDGLCSTCGHRYEDHPNEDCSYTF